MIPKLTERIAIFPGSFNPFTIGHLSILERFIPLFDKVYVAVGSNYSKSTSDIKDHLEQIRKVTSHLQGVEVIEYDGLTVDAARSVNAAYIIRGVRTVVDFENEKKMADVNRRLSGIETIIMFTRPELEWVSSSLVRELQHFGLDISHLLP